MHRAIRIALVLAGAATLILALGFGTRQPWATDLWPWPDGRLSFIFVASIAAAIGVPVIWIGLGGDFGAAASGSVNLIVAFGGTAIYLFALWWGEGGGRLLATAIAFGLGALLVAAIWGWSARIPLRDPRPLPRPVRLAFGLFAVLLVLVSVALIARAPYVFPWPLDRRSSVIYGLVFLGAATYFIPAIIWPRWGNATGQLLGFLAYDLVLIVPFLQHFAAVRPEHRLSLIIYTAVVVGSGALAVYYLFLHPATRLQLATPARARPLIGVAE